MLISGGSLAPVSFSDATPTAYNRNYYPQTGLALADKAFASYAAVYKTQLWVATLVNKIAYGTARLPLKVYTRAADGSRTSARDTPYGKLLRNPNGRHDPFFFWLWTASTFEVYGEAMWVKVRPAPGRPPTSLWPLHPSNVYTRRDDDTGELVYEYHLGSASAPLLSWGQDDIVHFRSYNPDNQIRGMSRLEPLRQTIVNEDAARRASAAFWSNGGRPSMALTHPGTLSQQAQDRLKASWDVRHSGVDSWGKTAILEEGMTPHVFPLNAEEMQYIESRRINREEACGIYDVPPPVVHILDRATFSNITEQMRSMYRDTMAPRLSLYESVLDTQLRTDFSPKDDVYAEFLMDEVLRGAFEDRAIANQSAINSGQRTPNEIRRLDNLPPLPGGDRLYINAASIPLEAAELSPPPGTTIIDHPQAVKALDEDTVRKVLGRVSRAKSLGEIDPVALVAGLNGSSETVRGALDAAKAADLSVAEFRSAMRDLEERPDPTLELAKSVALLAAKETPVNVTVEAAPAPNVSVGDVAVHLPGGKTVKTVTRDANGDIATITEES